MKPKTLAATVLITLGIATFIYQGITFMIGRRDASIDSIERTHSFPLPPILGAIALIGGIAWLLVDKKDFKPAATP